MKLSLNKVLLLVLVLSQSRVGIANSIGINLQNTGNKLIEQSKKTETLSERIQRNAIEARKAFQAKFPNLTKWVQENPKATATIAILAIISVSECIVIKAQNSLINSKTKNLSDLKKLCNESNSQIKELIGLTHDQQQATEAQMAMMMTNVTSTRAPALNLEN